MARKITTRFTGDPVLGALRVSDNTITTLGTDANLVIDPNGSGQVNIVGNLQINNASSLKLADADNSNFVNIKSPASLSADYTLTMPADDGNSGQVLQTDGSGILTWANVVIAISDDTTTNSTFYPVVTSTTSGSVQTLNVSSSKISFNPSTGTINVGIVTGSSASSGNLVLRSTTSGTKGQVYIDESTASSSTTSGALRVAGGVGIAGSCYVGGTMSCTTLVETSSIAYKENVAPIENALDKILQLAGVTYDRKDGSTKGEAGLIKEDVEKILPNLVFNDGIHYTKLTAYLVEAIKELKNEIKQLKG